MSFEEDRRSNGSRANNLTVRYIDARPRPRDIETDVRERERFERCRMEREERERQHRRVGGQEIRCHNKILLDTTKDKRETEQEITEMVRTAR